MHVAARDGKPRKLRGFFVFTQWSLDRRSVDFGDFSRIVCRNLRRFCEVTIGGLQMAFRRDQLTVSLPVRDGVKRERFGQLGFAG